MPLYIQDQIDFLLIEKGTDITINGIPTSAIIEYMEKVDIESIKLITKAPLHRGDLITVEGNDYLINSEINLERFDKYYEGIAQSCNYDIKFIINNVPIPYNCIVSSQSFDITSDKYFMLPEGKIMVTLQFSNNTNTIKLQDRFIKMGNPWKISGIDKTHEGLIILTCDIDSIITGDDMGNEIPFYEGNSSHSYVLSSTPSPVSIVVGVTKQLATNVMDNGVLVTNPTFTYSSNTPTIASVSATGLITGVAVGTCIIIVSFVGLDGQTYTKTIATNVTAQVARTFTVSGSAEMYLNPAQNETYTVIDSATGLAVTDLTFTYSLSNYSNASIVSSTSNSVILHPLVSSQVKLTCTSGTYTTWKVISMQNSF